MNRERRILVLFIWGALLILIAAGVRWFFDNFERQTETIPTGYSIAALRNPFLAFERLLQRMEIPVESLQGRAPLADLPSSEDTLLINGLGALNKERSAALRQWLESGGHLITTPLHLTEDDIASAVSNDFLANFGFSLHEDATTDGGDDNQIRQQVETAIGTLKVGFRANRFLDTSAATIVQIRAGGHLRLAQIEVGKGLLTVASDLDFLTNRKIDQQDNALFAAYLCAPRGSGKVWLVHDSEIPWIGELLWSRVPQLVISVSLLALLWIWSLSARIGPLQTVPPRQRRNLLEHLEAAGHFLWQEDRSAALIAPTRRRVLQAWNRLQPNQAQADSLQRVHAIAEVIHEPENAIAKALTQPPRSADDLITQAQLLQRLWQRANLHQRTAETDERRA